MEAMAVLEAAICNSKMPPEPDVIVIPSPTEHVISGVAPYSYAALKLIVAEVISNARPDCLTVKDQIPSSPRTISKGTERMKD